MLEQDHRATVAGIRLEIRRQPGKRADGALGGISGETVGLDEMQAAPVP